MAPNMLAAVLPLQLVCQLVVPGAENFAQNSNANIAAINQVPSPKELTKLPEGYVAYPDVGMAYKVHTDTATSAVARKLCIAEGGRLAFIDTPKIIELVKSQELSNDAVLHHVGIHKFDGSWVSSSDGSPVSSSIPWGAGEPKANMNCAQISMPNLYARACNELRRYVCEIPIPESSLTE